MSNSPIGVGYIIKPHGIKGEVVASLDIGEKYNSMESIFVEVNQRLIPFFIQSIKPHGDRFILKFEDVNHIEEIEKLLSCSIYVSSDFFSEDDHFLSHQIVGYKIIDKKLGELGIVLSIYEKPYQSLLAFESKGKEVLVPIHEDIILNIDSKKREVEVMLPEGLLDIYIQ